jgi:hypothetical protein
MAQQYPETEFLPTAVRDRRKVRLVARVGDRRANVRRQRLVSREPSPRLARRAPETTGSEGQPVSDTVFLILSRNIYGPTGRHAAGCFSYTLSGQTRAKTATS